MVDEIRYQTADSLFTNPKYTSIQKDVADQVKRENDRPIPFCESVAGRQAVQWSGLLEKTL